MSLKQLVDILGDEPEKIYMGAPDGTCLDSDLGEEGENLDPHLLKTSA